MHEGQANLKKRMIGFKVTICSWRENEMLEERCRKDGVCGKQENNKQINLKSPLMLFIFPIWFYNISNNSASWNSFIIAYRLFYFISYNIPSLEKKRWGDFLPKFEM